MTNNNLTRVIHDAELSKGLVYTKGMEKGIWRLPLYVGGLKESDYGNIKNLKNCNKYLRNVYRRLWKLSLAGDMKKFMNLVSILMGHSTSFHVYAFIEATSGVAYKYRWEDVLRWFNEYRDILRLNKVNLKVKRTYIAKPNGKFRPIGVPSIASKAALTAIEKVLRIALDKNIGDYQHGFRLDKSCQTASWALVCRLREGVTKIFEFDLQAYFNSVNVTLICGRLNNLLPGLGNWIKGITFNTFPKMKNYEEERELERIRYSIYNIFRVRGFTQGSPASPLLSIWALEFAGFNSIEGLIMYADDGIYTGTDENVIYKLNSPRSKLAGIELATQKKLGWTNSFEFLGLSYDLARHTIRYKTLEVNYLTAPEEDIKRILRYACYGTSSNGQLRHWIHFPVFGSLIGRKSQLLESLPLTAIKVYHIWLNKLLELKNSLWYHKDNELWKQLQAWGLKFVSVHPYAGSTLASLELLKYVSDSPRSTLPNHQLLSYKSTINDTLWSKISESNGNLFIRFPHTWGQINQDAKLRKLIQKAKRWGKKLSTLKQLPRKV